MRTFFVIENEQFKMLQAIERATGTDRQRKDIKFKLLEPIKEALGRKYRNSKKLASVIDEIVYKATDRGYSFNGRETLAKKLGISLPTVDRAIKALKESGRVFLGYRENPNSNGLKTPVIIFKNHANFEAIRNLLNLHDKVHDNVDDKLGDEKTLTGTGDSAQKKAPTYYLPNYLYNNHLYAEPTSSSFIKYVPKQLQSFGNIFGDNLATMWQRIRLAFNRSGIDVDTHSQRSVGMNVLTSAVKYFKNGQVRTPQEQCKFAYKVAKSQIEQRYTDKPNEQSRPTSSKPERTVIRREKLPHWFKNRNKGNSTVESVKAISDQVETSKKENKADFEALIKKFKEGTV